MLNAPKLKGRPPINPRLDALEARIAALEALATVKVHEVAEDAKDLRSQYQALFDTWPKSIA